MAIKLRSAALFTMLLCCAFVAETVAALAEPTLVKFLPDDAMPPDALRSFLDARHIGEYRVVEIDADALRQIIREAQQSASTESIPPLPFPLIDESAISIQLWTSHDNHEGWKSGLAIFTGTVAGEEYSSAQCVIGPDGSVRIVIRLPGQRYVIEKTSILPYHIYWSLGEGYERALD